MKQKHNKKRNTAFLYEVLTRELTKAVIEKKLDRKSKITSIIKEFFRKDSILALDLGYYKNLSETSGVELHTADKLLQETKFLYSRVSKKKLFNEQTRLISKINKILSKEAFSNFVPNYKDLATIYQILNASVGSKERLILEEEYIKKMCTKVKEVEDKEMVPIDNIIYNTFVKKFNEEYGDRLHKEQKILLEKYIASFIDNGLELKIFLNEELARIKALIKKSFDSKELIEDREMKNKAKQVLDTLQGYGKKDIKNEDFIKILKAQSLVRELNN
ncbi:hypothetical protein CL634_10775 [bacterium]|nr:hypothetical protein [bacterium]